MKTIALSFTFLITLLHFAYADRSFYYDAVGRLTLVSYDTGEGVRYAYDDADNVTSVNAVQVPVAPSDLTVDRQSDFFALVNWQDRSDDETGYRVFRRRADGLKWEQIAVLAANATAFGDVSLNPGIEYVYRVAAVGNDGDSAYSQTASTARLAFDSILVDTHAPAGSEPVQIVAVFNTKAGTVYRLQRATDLIQQNWADAPFALQRDIPLQNRTLPGTGQPVTLYFNDGVEVEYFRLQED